jgi:short-subunit dehydrogenase
MSYKVYQQFTLKRSFLVFNPPSSGSYKRTILITGATDGIGKQLSIELAVKTRENFVIIHGRVQRNCEKVLQEIAVEQKVLAPSNVAFVVADFNDFQQVNLQNFSINSRKKIYDFKIHNF